MTESSITYTSIGHTYISTRQANLATIEASDKLCARSNKLNAQACLSTKEGRQGLAWCTARAPPATSPFRERQRIELPRGSTTLTRPAQSCRPQLATDDVHGGYRDNKEEGEGVVAKWITGGSSVTVYVTPIPRTSCQRAIDEARSKENTAAGSIYA